MSETGDYSRGPAVIDGERDVELGAQLSTQRIGFWWSHGAPLVNMTD
jgi:hypothetical protein